MTRNVQIPKNYPFDQNSKNILNDILKPKNKGANASAYRAAHYDSINLIEHLEQDGLIKRETDEYKLFLCGLFVADSVVAEDIKHHLEKIFLVLRDIYLQNQTVAFSLKDITEKSRLSNDDVYEYLLYLLDAPIWSLKPSKFTKDDNHQLKISEYILRFSSFEEMMTEQLDMIKSRYASSVNNISHALGSLGSQTINMFSSRNHVLNSKTTWQEIENEYGVTKRSVGKKMRFIKNIFTRKIIFRDIEQAFLLANTGFSKPATILTGGIIEELLRLYLQFKNVKPTKDDFDGYIKECEKQGLLKVAISRLTDSVRHFRNYVHLEKEKSPRYSISKSTAKGAVASLFTIINDFL